MTEHPAFAYIRRGWWVLPLHSMRDGACSCGAPNDGQLNGRRHTAGKHPRTANGLKDATNDAKVLQGWLDQWPDMNVGIATGPSGLYVLDVDPGKGGTESLNKLLTKVGEQVMNTLLVETGSGGLHVYWLRPESLDEHNTASLLGPGLDSRGVGGYVVAPPSNHVSGGSYKWAKGADPETAPLLAMPETILRELKAARASKSKGGIVPHNIGSRIPKGRRDSTLLSLASSLRARGIPQEAIESTLLDVNARLCDPPQPEASVLDLARRYAANAGESLTRVILDAGEHDAANADRLIALFGHNIRFVHQWGWMIWDDARWTRDTFGRMADYAMQVARVMQEHALRLASGTEAENDRRKRLLRWAQASHNHQKMQAMLKAAEGRPEVRAETKDFDRLDGLLNVKNGIVDLKTGELGAHNRDLYLTSYVDIAFDPKAIAPKWEKFLRFCCSPTGSDAPDTELMAFLQRCAGYTLTGYVVEHCLFFLYGDGRNGKSTFINIIRELVGDLATTMAFGTLLESRESRTETALADLAGKRMATSIEGGGEARSFNEELLKSLTGGDKGIRARYLYGDAFFFDAKYKIWLANNHKPIIRGTDEGIWERIMLVPFRNHLTRAQRSKTLHDELMAELPGILAWAVRGAIEWARDGGLRPPRAVVEATDEYKQENDAFGRFLEEACTIEQTGSVAASDLLAYYNQWAEEHKEKALNANSLGRRMGKARAGLFKKDKQDGGYTVWHGLRIGRQLPPAPSQSTLGANAPANVMDPRLLEQHDRMMLLERTVREQAKASGSYVTGSGVEAAMATHGWTVSEIRDGLRRLLDRGVLMMPKGFDTYAPKVA